MFKISIAEHSERLKPFEDTILESINTAITKVQQKLPVDDVSIVVFDKPEWTIPETGEGGYSTDANNLEVYMNPEFPDFERSVLGINLERCIAHELHHCMRWRNPGYGETLLEHMISEGLADHFEVEISEGNPGPWSVRLSEDELEVWLEKAKPLFNSKEFNRDAWMFGSDAEGIPKSTGYSLGFKLVGDYLKKHPQERASTLYSVRAEEFTNS